MNVCVCMFICKCIYLHSCLPAHVRSCLRLYTCMYVHYRMEIKSHRSQSDPRLRIRLCNSPFRFATSTAHPPKPQPIPNPFQPSRFGSSVLPLRTFREDGSVQLRSRVINEDCNARRRASRLYSFRVFRMSTP